MRSATLLFAQSANLREASDFLDGDLIVLDLAMPRLRQRTAKVYEEKWGKKNPKI